MVPSELSDHELDAKERNFFDQYYRSQRYNRTGWRLRFERERRALDKVCRQSEHRLGRVLSLGCGDGMFECMLAGQAESVVGVDLSPQATQLAAQNAAQAGIGNVQFLTKTISDLDYAGKFDTVIALAFLHHIPEETLGDYLGRFRSWLRPGGLFYSQDPNDSGALRKVGRVMMRGGYDRYHTPDERELNPTEMVDLMRQAGFVDVSVGWIDFSLIPVSFILAGGPDWPLYACRAIDAVLCRSPFGRWCSGFNLTAWKR